MHASAMTHQVVLSGLKLLGGLVCVACLLSLFACGGTYHTVKPGQTLYRISRVYQVDEATLARMNGIKDPARLSVGTRLFIPGADRVKHVPVIKQPSVVKQTRPPARPVKQVRKKPPVKKSPTPKAVAKVIPKKYSKPKTNQAGKQKKLQWPVRGKIVRTYSPKAKAGRGKGIEIAVRAGSEVRAAEAGKVIYSGDGVKGYGHLIILQHENELFTVYGFNSRNLVSQGEFVSQGEKVAMSGVPPSGGKARLHFEVRKGKAAVNPILYLP